MDCSPIMRSVSKKQETNLKFTMEPSINKNRTAQQIRADRDFQKELKKYVKLSGRRVIVLSLEDNKVAKSGEESLVRLARERDDITLKNLEMYMLAMGEPSCGKDKKYGLKYVKSPDSVMLPPMKYKIEGRSWSLNVGRNQLTEYMCQEGYGEKGSLSYKEDRPAWWPDSIDHEQWIEKYKNPMGANIKHSALFLRAILQYYGHDENYHNEVIHEESMPKRKKPQRKWKPTKSKQVVLDDTIDEDNEEEVANRARAAEAMEAARAGGRDTAEASDMEDVLDTADDHDTAEVTDVVMERYEVVEVIQGKDKPCYICRAFTAEDLFFCRSCYNPYHQLCLPQHKGLNGSGSMCGRCLNSKDSYEEDMSNKDSDMSSS